MLSVNTARILLEQVPKKIQKNESENAPKIDNNSPTLNNDDLGERLNPSEDPGTNKEENGLTGDKIQDIFAE